MKWFYLIAGGAVGTVARYVLSGATFGLLGGGFPYGTFIVNLLGCFLIGFLASLSSDKWMMGEEMRLLLIVGFCGAFTTFSTFMLENVNLIKAGASLKAFAYVLGSVVIGFIVFRLGVRVAELI